MPFDDVHYISTPLVMPADYIADTPLVDRCLSAVLQTGYFVARHRARCLVSQDFPKDDLEPSQQLTTSFVSEGATWAEYCGGYAWVPEHVTHLVANIQYVAVGLAPGAVEWRLGGDDGTFTATSDPFEQDIQGEANSTFTGLGRVYTAQIDCRITSLTRAARIYMSVEARASVTNSTIIALKPYWIGIRAASRRV